MRKNTATGHTTEENTGDRGNSESRSALLAGAYVHHNFPGDGNSEYATVAVSKQDF